MSENPINQGGYGVPREVPPSENTLPPMPEQFQTPSVKPDMSDIPECPLHGEPCHLEACAWFNDFSGYCWVPEMALSIKRMGGRWR